MNRIRTRALAVLQSRLPATPRTPRTPSILRYYSEKPSWQSKIPLSAQLAAIIDATGPLSIGTYMRHTLLSSSGGYYTTSPTPFGAGGDFITSPEISQMFGEVLAVFLVAEWMQQGRPVAGVELVELGPGKGTLMGDVLRALQRFPEMTRAVERVWMVEASEGLRGVQRERLCEAEVAQGKGEDEVGKEAEEVMTGRTRKELGGIEVRWVDMLRQVPHQEGESAGGQFVVAHEFFDALPIHAFEATAEGWRELMVAHYPPASKPTDSATDSPESSSSSSPSTPSTPSTPADSSSASTTTPNTPEPEIFGLTRAAAPTRYSRLLPTLSPRFTALQNTPGSIIEISPESLTTIDDLSKRIGNTRRGAALIIDYGPATAVPANSLRGIRGHRTVSPFHAPGATDVSADVDFGTLAERALHASEGVEVHGPVPQGVFLGLLGLRERMMRIIEGLAAKGEEGKGDLVKTQYRRLTGGGEAGMGEVYKAMAIVPERGGVRPVGFGGSVGGVGREEKKEGR